MSASKEQGRRDSFVQCVLNIKNRSGEVPRNEFIHRLIQGGWDRKFTERHIDEAFEGKQILRKKGSGKIPVIFTPEKRSALIEKFEENTGMSQREAAIEFQCSKSRVNRILQQEKCKCRTRENAPKVTENQWCRQKSCCRYLYQNLLSPSAKISVVMDDESYFYLAPSKKGSMRVYYARDPNSIPHHIKKLPKEKFPQKLMVHMTISEKGASEPYFVPARHGINTDRYKEILETCVLPFIRKFHKNGRYVFWPDLATSHYSNGTQKFLFENGISFLPKSRNPPNCPIVRPIERFWAHLKAKLNREKITTFAQLQERIHFHIKNTAKSYYTK